MRKRQTKHVLQILANFLFQLYSLVTEMKFLKLLL